MELDGWMGVTEEWMIISSEKEEESKSPPTISGSHGTKKEREKSTS